MAWGFKEYAEMHGVKYTPPHEKKKKKEDEKRAKLPFTNIYEAGGVSSVVTSSAKTSGGGTYGGRATDAPPQPLPESGMIKRSAGSLGIGLLEGGEGLRDKYNITRQIEKRGGMPMPERAYVPLITPEDSERYEEKLGLKGTLGESIWRGIGAEIPSIIASYGAVGAATKIPRIGKALTGAGKWTETGRRGVAAGAVYTPITKEDPTMKDYLENMALFGVGDVAFMGAAHGIGKGISKGKEALKGFKRAPGTAPEPELSLDYLLEGGIAPETKPDYAPWVREDLVNDFNQQRAEEIPRILTREQDPWSGMRGTEYSQPWPDYIPPQGIVPDFAAGPRGISRGMPKEELPGLPERLALPGGEERLALPGQEMKALYPGQDFAFSEGYPMAGHWFVDPYGVARGEPGMPLALPEGKAGRGSRFVRQDEGQISRSDIGDPEYLTGLRKRYSDFIDAEVSSMKDEIGGVLKYRPGEDAPLLRASMNPAWYRDFWQKHLRAPREGEWRDLAIRNLIEGNPETGEPANDEFLAILSELSRGQKLPEEWHGLQKGIREMDSMQEPELAPLIDDMQAEQAKVEPYGLTRDMGRLNDVENGIRGNTRMKDQADFGQYEGVRFKKDNFEYRPRTQTQIDASAKRYEANWPEMTRSSKPDLAIEGANRILDQGLTDYKSWSNAMVASYGNGIEYELPTLWNKSNRLAELYKRKTGESRAALNRTGDDYKVAEQPPSGIEYKPASDAERQRWYDKWAGKPTGPEQGELFGEPRGNLQPRPKGRAKAVRISEDQGNLARREQIEKAPVFYSQLQRVIEQKMPNRATPEQIKGILSKGAVKEEELKWADLDGFLEGKQKLSKQEVLDYLRANDVQVEEVVKGGSPYSLDGINDNTRFRVDNDIDTWSAKEIIESANELAEGIEEQGNFTDIVKAVEYLREHGSDIQVARQKNTQYEQYQLPGGENYRELLFTMPGEKNYQSSHWSEPNVLAHVRFNDRTGANGEKVLHVEEIQSDWHQEGRRKGYYSDNQPKGWTATAKPNDPFTFTVKDANGNLVKEVYLPSIGRDAEQEAIRRAAGLDISGTSSKTGVPDAPFKTTWHEFAMKRMIRYAAENGYDRITWTTGEQQAARYDLSKQVSLLSARKTKDGKYQLFIEDLRGNELPGYGGSGKKVSAEEMEEHVGKEYAKALIDGADRNYGKPWPRSAEINPEFFTLRPKDFKIGGEGMKGFYDRMIPSWLNKYAKKWGARVEESVIEYPGNGRSYDYEKTTNGTGKYEIFDTNTRQPVDWVSTEQEAINYINKLSKGETYPVHSIPITDAMRNSVLYEGQPKFKRTLTPEQQQDLKVLKEVAEERKIGPFRIGKVELAPDAMERPEFRAAGEIAEKLGLRLVTYRGKGVARGAQYGRTIYLSESVTDPLDYVFWHETAHSMATTHRKYYERLLDLCFDHLADAEGVNKHYWQQGYAREERPHEFIADVFAEAVARPGFFARMAEQAPELIKPLLEAIDRLIANVKGKISEDDTIVPFLRDWEALREKIREEVATPYFRDAMGEKQFVETFGKQWQEPAAKAKVETAKADPTNTPEFRKWFGDSKVVDEQGKPLVVYHGSPQKGINIFNVGKRGSNTGATDAEKAFFFTDSPNVAKSYMEEDLIPTLEGQKLIDRYDAIKQDMDAKGLTLRNRNTHPDYNEWSNISHMLHNDTLLTNPKYHTVVKSGEVYPTYLNMQDPYIVDVNGMAYDAGKINKVIHEAIQNGNDGVIIKNVVDPGDGRLLRPSTVYAIFEPNQIKSVYNRGTFDPTNPDIRFKLGAGGKSPVEDFAAMVQYGVKQIPKGNFAHFSKLIQQQFPDELAGYGPEITERLMKDVWEHSRRLRDTGETVVTMQGKQYPIKREDVASKGMRGVTAPVRGATMPGALGARDDLLGGLDINPAELSDISGTQAGWRDIWRNMRDVFGEKFPEVKGRILDPLEDAKANWVDHQRELTDRLYSDIVDGLGIKKGSRESELVQLYGEGGYRHWEAIPRHVARNEQSINHWIAQLEKKHGRGNIEFTGDGAEIVKPFDYDDLVREVGAERAADIVQAENWFRQVYDDLIDQVNAVRQQIYPYAEGRLAEIDAKIQQVKTNKTLFPNAAERNTELDALEAQRETFMRGKVVPKRKDYFRHFREMDGIEGIQNLFDTSAQISPELAGKSMYTRPKSKFHGFMQQRGMGEYKPDAVGGMLDYIPSATYAIHIDPQGAAFRQLERELVDVMGDNTGINKFLEYLKYYADDIQGKTNFFDRNLQFLTDRKLFKGLVQLNNRIKGNVILGNAGTMVSQLFNIPQGLAFAKQHSAPGLTRYLSSAFERHSNPEAFMANNPMAQSRFLKERYSGDMYRRFATKVGEKAKNVAVIGMEDVDRFATEFMWNANYEKALHTKGIGDPVRYADYHTRRLVAGRGIGEVPLMQKSKAVQLVAPFQVEVGNLWSVMGDMRRDGDWGAFVILPLALWLFNEGAERLRGSGVALDPIQAIEDSVKIAQDDKDKKAYRIMGRMAGEVLSNMPLGQTAAAMAFDENQRKQFFGREDPTRYGSSVLIAKGAQDPIFKMALPFGGLQAEKAIKGIGTLSQGGSYDKKGNLRYPVSADPINAVKGVTFGPGGFRETRGYYEEGGRPLSEKQTAEYERRVGRGVDREQAYGDIQRKRKINSLRNQIRAIRRDKDETQEERARKIESLKKELQKVKAGS